MRRNQVIEETVPVLSIEIKDLRKHYGRGEEGWSATLVESTGARLAQAFGRTKKAATLLLLEGSRTAFVRRLAEVDRLMAKVKK